MEHSYVIGSAGRAESQVRPVAAPGEANPPWHPGEILLIFCTWTLIATLVSASVFLDQTGNARDAVRAIRVVITFFEAYAWAALTLVIFWLVRRYAAERYAILQRVLIFGGTGVVIALGVAHLMQFVRQTFSADDLNQPFASASAIGVAVEALTYTGVLAAGFARHYLRRFHAHREAAIVLEAQAAQLQTQLVDAQLAALRAQLNPHFLFNTLHAISALANRDPAGVRRMLSRLSELLRISLDEASQPETPLKRELSFARRYLELMRLQLQSTVEMAERIDAEVLDARVPNFLLQPLIENAIKHGIARLCGPGRLSLDVQRVGAQVKLVLRNDAPADAAVLPVREGVGLRNTRDRLVRLYGERQSLVLRVQTEPEVEFIVEILFPFVTDALPPNRDTPRLSA